MVNEVAPETSRQVTLGQALEEYLAAMKPEQRSLHEQHLRKYVEYAGEQQVVSEITGSRVESFATTQIVSTDPAAGERVAALKAWFQFLKKKEYTTQNLGVNIRVPRTSGARFGGNGFASSRPGEAPLEMTAEGLTDLKAEIEQMEAQRANLVRSIEVARQDGDLRENAPYHAAREALAFHEQRMRSLNESLRRAVVVDRVDDDKSAVGSTVTVTNLDEDRQFKYTLVSAREANAAEKKISVDSPVGQKLLGKRPGDEVRVTTPRGEIAFRIDAITQDS